MDPNANLDQQLDLAKQIQQLIDSDAHYDEVGPKLEDLARELIERVEALDHWLTGGGFLPERWTTTGPGRWPASSQGDGHGQD